MESALSGWGAMVCEQAAEDGFDGEAFDFDVGGVCAGLKLVSGCY